MISAVGLVKPPPEISDMNYVHGTAGVAPRPQRPMGAAAPASAGERGGGGGGGGFNPMTQLSVRGLPLLKPPYGRITAIDLDTGTFRWQIAHGDTPDNIKNNPALKGLTIPRTGRPGLLGPLTTKTLVICGEAGFNTTPAASAPPASRLRQNDRQRSGCGRYPRSAERLADELHV